MMTLFSILVWLAAHWYIAGIVAAIGALAAVRAGFVSIAQIVEAVLRVFAAVAQFFTTPSDQIAAKVLYGIAMLALGLSIGVPWGDDTGAGRERAKRQAAEQAVVKESVKAHEDAENKIPPIAPETEPPAPRAPRFTIFKLRPTNACPPVAKCPAAPRYRNSDPGVRNDRNNRDNH